MLLSAQQTGSVRAADQFIPGATITATQGDKKVVAFTDEAGQYKLNLGPGEWDIQIEMMGFNVAHGQVAGGGESVYTGLELWRCRGWTRWRPPEASGKSGNG